MEKNFAFALLQRFDLRLESHQAQEVLQNGLSLLAFLFNGFHKIQVQNP